MSLLFAACKDYDSRIDCPALTPHDPTLTLIPLRGPREGMLPHATNPGLTEEVVQRLDAPRYAAGGGARILRTRPERLLSPERTAGRPGTKGQRKTFRPGKVLHTPPSLRFAQPD